MAWLGTAAAVAIIFIVLLDAFEVVLLPRRVRHGLRLSRLFYRMSWRIGRTGAPLLPPGRWRTGFLSTFGPLSLCVLIVIWAAGLIASFALLHWSLHLPTNVSAPGYGNYLYFSGVTFFTLGYGDVVATCTLGRFLSVVEAGMGFVFLAVIVSYLPVLYQAFSSREITIALLDARAGSPPTAAEFLGRTGRGRGAALIAPILAEWERWAAELLESHISFPVLSYYRSQHENQSWVATLTVILDASALVIAAVEGADGYQARLTFAMARHAAVDLAMVFNARLLREAPDRLPGTAQADLMDLLRGAGVPLKSGPAVATDLAELRKLYEPFVAVLGAYFEFPLPPFMPKTPPVDNWQTSAWLPRSPGLGGLSSAAGGEDHFG